MLGGMRTYSSLDLRERALAAVDRRGMARKEAVGVFGVSLATLKRWLKRREQAGSAPKRRPGMRRRVGATSEERRALRRQLEENPEAPPEEHRGPWERGCGVRVSVATRRAGRSAGSGGDLRAKTVAASERDERARSDWWHNRLAVLDPSRLVFADECGGSNVFGLAPLRARAPGGERAHGKAPRNRGKNTTLLLASMSAEGMGPCVVAVEEATTARVFEAYDVGRALAPALRG